MRCFHWENIATDVSDPESMHHEVIPVLQIVLLHGFRSILDKVFAGFVILVTVDRVYTHDTDH